MVLKALNVVREMAREEAHRRGGNMGKQTDDDKAIGEFQLTAESHHVHTSVFRLADRDAPDMGGSCVPVKLGSRYFVATAAHVVPTGHRFEIILREPPGRCFDQFESIKRDADVDVAALELPQSAGPLIKDSCVTEDQILTGLDQENVWPVIVIGYPGQFAKLLREDVICPDHTVQHYGCSTFTYHGESLPYAEWPTARLDRLPKKGRDLFVHYDPEKQQQLERLHPQIAGRAGPLTQGLPPRMPGMSGGGIWVVPRKTVKGIWEPEAYLVALDVDWNAQEKWLRGTLIDLWLGLVGKSYPDLLACIQRIRRGYRRRQARVMPKREARG